MTTQQLAKTIDHTLLKPAKNSQIETLCQEAIQHGFASVCVNPQHIKLAAKLLEGSDVEVCTVVGFPLGENTTATKVFETKNAIKLGATEIDMVTCNLTPKQIENACIACVNAGATFVKTSTGFGTGGATLHDVALMAQTVKPHGLQVKASGGVRTHDDAIAMIQAGADRIGTSGGVTICKG